MLEPVSTGVAITLLVKSASPWLPVINEAIISPAREALIGKLTEKTIDKGFEIGRKGRDEKEQVHHLELALKNSAERGLALFQTTEEQQQYSKVISILSTDNAKILRYEAMRLFTLDAPDLTKLNTLFNNALHVHSLGLAETEVNAVPYPGSFFNALLAELYIDSLFHDKVSDAIRVSGTLRMQRSLIEVLSTLNQIGGTLADNYTPEQFEKDVIAYTEHIERTLRYLKLVGVVPKERTSENRDPELDGIFVPLRISMRENIVQDQQVSDSLVDLLEQTFCMILLGGPGSGKSTATRHLAWSHAIANLSASSSLITSSLLSGKPLPLRSAK